MLLPIRRTPDAGSHQSYGPITVYRPAPDSAITELVQIVFVHAEEMADFVEDGDADFTDQVGLGVANLFDVVLEDIDDVGHAAGLFHAAFQEGPAFVQAEEEFVVVHAEFAEELAGRAVLNLDAHFLHEVGERVRQFGQGPLDQLGESRFAHVVSHGIYAGMISRRLLNAAFCVLGSFLLAGCGMPSFLITPVGNTNKLEESVVEEGKGSGKVAIIDVEGMLANAKTGGFLQPTENKLSLFVQQLELAAKDDSVKAVVLRVNSPGGTVTCTDTMYEVLKRFKKETHKPVVASTQEVTASGGYYVACAADKIVACPTSVVGSIGVIFMTFDASGTMQKIGLRSEAIKSGPFKDIGSPFRPSTPEERAIMQGIVDEYYARFKRVVADNRPIKDVATMTLVSDGRVFSGRRAVELGLADKEGLLSDAIDLAREMGHAPKAEVVLYKRPYGYSGSIYATSELPAPQAGSPSSLHVDLPAASSLVPTGFYFLWQP